MSPWISGCRAARTRKSGKSGARRPGLEGTLRCCLPVGAEPAGCRGPAGGSGVWQQLWPWVAGEREAAPGSPVLPASSRAKLGSHPASPVRNLERSSAGRAQLPLPGATLLCWDKKDKAQLGFGVKKELPAAQTGAAASGGSCSGVPQCPWGAGSNHPSPEEDGKEHEPPTCFHPREFPIHPAGWEGRAEIPGAHPKPPSPAPSRAAQQLPTTAPPRTGLQSLQELVPKEFSRFLPPFLSPPHPLIPSFPAAWLQHSPAPRFSLSSAAVSCLQECFFCCLLVAAWCENSMFIKPPLCWALLGP